MKDLILALIIFLLAYLLFGKRRAEKWAKFRQAKKNYQKANENFVQSFRTKELLLKMAELQTRVILIACCCTFIITAYYVSPVAWTGIIVAILCNMEPVSKPIFLILTGKDHGWVTLYDGIRQSRIKSLYRKYQYNDYLLPVYLKKREEKREELLSIMKQIRK